MIIQSTEKLQTVKSSNKSSIKHSKKAMPNKRLMTVLKLYRISWVVAMIHYYTMLLEQLANRTLTDEGTDKIEREITLDEMKYALFKNERLKRTRHIWLHGELAMEILVHSEFGYT